MASEWTLTGVSFAEVNKGIVLIPVGPTWNELPVLEIIVYESINSIWGAACTSSEVSRDLHDVQGKGFGA